jgi:hypothetical protein
MDVPTSTTRRGLSEEWLRHREALEHLVPVQKQWIGGSFTTAKVDPGDVDLCSFIDGLEFDALPEPVRNLVGFMVCGHPARDYWSVDSFHVFVYPVGHPLRALTDAYMASWSNTWSHTREDEQGVKTERGFVEIP